MKKLLSAALALACLLSASFMPFRVSAQRNPSRSSQQQKPLPHPRVVSPEQRRALDELAPRLSTLDLDRNAVPAWLMGDLGPAQGEPRAAALDAMRQLNTVFRRTPDDDFVANRKELADQLGQVHVRLEQRYRGLRVVGGELIVHMKNDRVIGVNGRYIPDIQMDVTPALPAEAAVAEAVRVLAPGGATKNNSPELVIHFGEDDVARLAWSQLVSYVDGEGMWQLDEVFADARSGELLDRHPQVMTAKHRQIYDGNKECLNGFNLYILPGTLLFEEGGSSSDEVAAAAYEHTGLAYDFYKEVFGRDSFDDAGASLVSTLHLSFYSFGSGACTPNNAVWLSYITSTEHHQMAFGDGDGDRFSPLAQSLDVVAHEFTHGVTRKTANLTYRGESGALNEAISDIMGTSTELYFQNGDWEVGEDVYTPGTAGDALRYMKDPALDEGQSPLGYTSTDYYPDRLFPNCTNSDPDNCGVHFNSGIANLAFFLMVEGGTHPRGKSSVVVPAIGLTKALHIWYRALTVYMTSGTNFKDARDTTMHAAADLFGGINTEAVDAVDRAWRAVGVAGKGFNILRNPGFESTNLLGSSSMGWTGQNVFDSTSTAPVAPAPRTGDWAALFGGHTLPSTETLYQDVTIDPTADEATLSFWLQIETDETTTTAVLDRLRIQLRDPSNNLLTTLATYSNLDPNANTGGYVRKSFDVTAYRGQTVRVYFTATSNSSNATYFLVDDTSLLLRKL